KELWGSSAETHACRASFWRSLLGRKPTAYTSTTPIRGKLRIPLQPLGPFDDPADVEAVEVRVRSYDGTLVPLSIVSKKGLKLDGSHPTLLSGYGAYAINMSQYYDPISLA